MKDILGRTLEVGMVCAFNPPKYKGIVLCTVEKLSEKKVTVSYPDARFSNTTEKTSVYPSDLAILDEKDVVLYYLRKKK